MLAVPTSSKKTKQVKSAQKDNGIKVDVQISFITISYVLIPYLICNAVADGRLVVQIPRAAVD